MRHVVEKVGERVHPQKARGVGADGVVEGVGGHELLKRLAEYCHVDSVRGHEDVKHTTVVDGVVPQDVVTLSRWRGQQGRGGEGLARLVDVVVAAGLHGLVGQHEVELASETVALQDVGHGGAGGFVHLDEDHVVLRGALSSTSIGGPAC